ncbi:substrate-binding domain-containing protein [Homoserinibacter sp. GY 40078]|uniref:substrate-binding domain-containing protein n=1 Tax=Homoserinibacter sp. GY 40078 TaxID=2603275 RepID=UPI00164FB665|nr:substrate-binding domain-containing protein [Homoserinibacter sp. GY 40078]
MRRAIGAGAAAAVIAGTLIACTPQPSGPPVAVLFPGSADDAWGASAAVLEQELAADGHAVEVRFAGDDIPGQLGQLREALAGEPAAVVIAPVDATAIAAVLTPDLVGEAAIIAYDDLVLDSGEVDYYATFDHRGAGRMRGEAFVAALGLDELAGAGAGSGSGAESAVAVELLAGSGDDRVAQEEFEGALEVLQPYLDSGVLAVPSGRIGFEQAAVLRASPTTAAKRVTELLDDGVALAGVLAPTDEMARAVGEVVSGAGLVVARPGGGAEWTASPVPSAPSTDGPSPVPGEPPPPDETAQPDAGDAGAADAGDMSPTIVVTGGGATLDGARAVAAGTLTATVYEDPRELARTVASMVREVVDGSEPTVTRGATTDNGMREVPTRLLEPMLIATREDASALLG